MNKIAILGCGYIGSAIAKHFAKKGFSITATTTRMGSLKDLANIIQKEIMTYGNDETMIYQLLKDNSILFITLFPSDEDYESAFLETAKTIRKVSIDANFPKKTLIFTSNTIVYGDHKGKWVDELSKVSTDTPQARALISSEKILLSLTDDLNWPVLVLRLSEVYGPLRELVKQVQNLQDKTLFGKGDSFTNMIHLEDVVLAADHLLTHELKGIYNLADDDHLTRKELFDKVCQIHHLNPLKWETVYRTAPYGNTRVSNHKLKSSGYKFRHPHRELLA